MLSIVEKRIGLINNHQFYVIPNQCDVVEVRISIHR